MTRFFGMMPCDEIEKEAKYLDKNNHTVIIQAGQHGWTVIYADGSTNYKDEDNTVECNFAKALSVAEDNLIEIRPYSQENI